MSKRSASDAELIVDHTAKRARIDPVPATLRSIFDIPELLLDLGKRVDILTWTRLTRIVSLHFDKETGAILPAYEGLHKDVFQYHLMHDFKSRYDPTAPDARYPKTMSAYFCRLFKFVKENPEYALSMDMYRMAYQAARIIAKILTFLVFSLVRGMDIRPRTAMNIYSRFIPPDWIAMAKKKKQDDPWAVVLPEVNPIRVGQMYPDASICSPCLLRTRTYVVNIPVASLEEYVPNPLIDRTHSEKQAVLAYVFRLAIYGLPKTEGLREIAGPLLQKHLTDVVGSCIRPWVQYIYTKAMPEMDNSMRLFGPVTLTAHQHRDPIPVPNMDEIYSREIGGLFTYPMRRFRDGWFLFDQAHEPTIEVATPETTMEHAAVVPLARIQLSRCIALVGDALLTQRGYSPVYEESWKITMPRSGVVKQVKTQTGGGFFLVQFYESWLADLDAVAILHYASRISDKIGTRPLKEIITSYPCDVTPSTLFERLACELVDDEAQTWTAYPKRDHTQDYSLRRVFEFLCTSEGLPDSDAPGGMEKFEAKLRKYTPGITDTQITEERAQFITDSNETAYVEFLKLIGSDHVRYRLRGTNMIKSFDDDDAMEKNMHQKWRFFV